MPPYPKPVSQAQRGGVAVIVVGVLIVILLLLQLVNGGVGHLRLGEAWPMLPRT
jgi:hypothetical protein